MDCARFKIKIKLSNTPGFGFIKILSTTFNELKILDPDITEDKSTDTSCSWTAKKESTIMIWKNGITVMATVSELNQKSSVTTTLQDINCSR